MARSREVLTEQLERIQRLQQATPTVNYSEKACNTIGICWGNGIGEEISNQAQRILEHCLASDITVVLMIKPISGLMKTGKQQKPFQMMCWLN